MKTRIVLVSLLLALLVACDKKEDDKDTGQNYTGTLTLDYARTFPAFTTTLSVPVEISATGQVFISQPLPHEFSGESDKMIDGERIKIREEGVIVISDIAPAMMQKSGSNYLEVAFSLMLQGEQTVWKWATYCWEQTDKGPYILPNSGECLLLFRIDNALLSESVCTSRCEDCWGRNNFRWRLQLHEAP